MKQEQINALLGALGTIRQRLDLLVAASGPKPSLTVESAAMPVHAGPCWSGCAMPEHGRTTPHFVDATFKAPSEPVEAPKDTSRAAWVRETLMCVQDALDSMIESAYENHKACAHRAEPVGSECWRQFHPQDIREMVGHAARMMSVEAPQPNGVPKENVVCL